MTIETQLILTQESIGCSCDWKLGPFVGGLWVKHWLHPEVITADWTSADETLKWASPWRTLLPLSWRCASLLAAPCASRRCARKPSPPESPHDSGRTRGTAGVSAAAGTPQGVRLGFWFNRELLTGPKRTKSLRTTHHLYFVRVDQMLGHGLDDQLKEEPGELGKKKSSSYVIDSKWEVT